MGVTSTANPIPGLRSGEGERGREGERELQHHWDDLAICYRDVLYMKVTTPRYKYIDFS